MIFVIIIIIALVIIILILMLSGSAGLAGFAKEVEIATQIKCIIADDSENCTVKGLGRLIDEEDTIYNKAL